MRQVLRSRPSYTKFTLATRNFEQVKPFARFKTETWCNDLAYVDKLAKDNNDIRYLLVRQDLFDRTVDAKGMKTKDSRKMVRAFLTIITRKDRTRKNWVDKGTELAGEFKKLCKADVIQNYSTISETTAAFGERKIQSLKNIIYRYMVDNGYKYIHKLTQFVPTTNSGRNCLKDLIPKIVKNSDFLSILYSRPLREFRKPKFKIGDRVRIWWYDSSFRKGFKPQFTQKKVKIVAFSFKKPPTYTIKDEQAESIRSNFYQKELIKVN